VSGFLQIFLEAGELIVEVGISGRQVVGGTVDFADVIVATVKIGHSLTHLNKKKLFDLVNY
jgi:hypothetical protein